MYVLQEKDKGPPSVQLGLINYLCVLKSCHFLPPRFDYAVLISKGCSTHSKLIVMLACPIVN